MIAEEVREMKGFRKVLVHGYGEIDDGLAFEAIKNGLSVFETFILEIEKFLRSYSSSKS
ncbi:MAG: HepT-like ribonuclease domain-containing protein [Candidatus Jordarchaeales archaeon]|nr:DUF86 domain-containing protein [Candidatus Jordarchaeia archaeon]